jgi:VWFA-related protein
MTEKAAEALRELRPGDRVGVMVFSTRSDIVQPFTENLAVIPTKIIGAIYQDRLGRTAFANEALIDAARYVASQKPGVRRAIVLVTDNDIFRNVITDEQVIRALNANNLLLSTILVGAAEEKTTARYRDPAQRPPDVRRLAQATGGDVVAGQNPGNALRHVLQDAVTKYTLQYPAPPAEPGKYRRLRVELSPEARMKHPGAVVEARPGYETGN